MAVTLAKRDSEDRTQWIGIGEEVEILLRRFGMGSTMKLINPLQELLSLQSSDENTEITAEEDERLLGVVIGLAKGLAIGWKGVEDVDGKALPWSLASFEDLIRTYPLFGVNFSTALAASLQEVQVSEKNDSGVSPTGKRGSEKKDGTTAKSASRPTPPVVGGNGAGMGSSAHG